MDPDQTAPLVFVNQARESSCVFFDFPLTVRAAPHECVIRTVQP